MNFDLRFPIGIMFTLFGVLVTVAGLVNSEASTRLGININLRWGIVMLLFGGFMLFLALRGKKSGPPPA
jgi:hypothetical protein